MPHRLIVAGYVSVVLAGGWAVNHASEARSTEKLRLLEAACLGVGNPTRALDRLNAPVDERLLREKFQPIVDCHATYFANEGEPVPLDANEETRYVELIRRGIRPVIRADGTVAPE